jgi:hypothetical protein
LRGNVGELEQRKNDGFEKSQKEEQVGDVKKGLTGQDEITTLVTRNRRK